MVSFGLGGYESNSRSPDAEDDGIESRGMEAIGLRRVYVRDGSMFA